MRRQPPYLSLDHGQLLDTLCDGQPTLFIQDVDGVCLGLVRDPLTRSIDPRYVEAAAQLGDAFRVLTNGEHIGRRGLQGVVERALGSPAEARHRGLYLPGLAAGGVQEQNRFGEVGHPGISAVELAFLGEIPPRLEAFLHRQLRALGIDPAARTSIAASAVLDNPVSPTLNLNPLYAVLRDTRSADYQHLQRATVGLMDELLDAAAKRGLATSFFVHLAPNLGRDEAGREHLLLGDQRQAGTTDFQFMLAGAIKEVGVLALLNREVERRSGHAPLGHSFHVRQAPRDLGGLLELARKHFDLRALPRLVGIGDTVSSRPGKTEGGNAMQRGGSDRGFLTLIQELGGLSGRDNRILYVDSSGGEVRRPGLDAEYLARCASHPGLAPWIGAQGISDAGDPLHIHYVFPGGHPQYVDFFVELARRSTTRR